MRATHREREACLEGGPLRQHFIVSKPLLGRATGASVSTLISNKQGSSKSLLHVSTWQLRKLVSSLWALSSQESNWHTGRWDFFGFFRSFLPFTTHTLPPAPTHSADKAMPKLLFWSTEKAWEIARIFPSSSPRIPVQKSSNIKFSLKRGVSENHWWASRRQATVKSFTARSVLSPGLQKLTLSWIRQTGTQPQQKGNVRLPTLNRKRDENGSQGWNQQVCKQDLSLIPHTRRSLVRDGRGKAKGPAEALHKARRAWTAIQEDKRLLIRPIHSQLHQDFFFFIRNPSLHKFLSIFYQIFIHFLSNSLHSRFPSPHSTKTTRQGQGWLPQYQTQWVTLLLTSDADHSQSLRLPSLWHLHWDPRFSSSPRYRALLSKALGSYPLSPEFLGCFSSLSTTTLLVDLILSRGLKGHLYADGICTYPHTLDLLSETCISHCLLSISTRVSDRLTCPEPNFWPAPPNLLH